MLLFLPQKLFLFLRNLHFCPDFWSCSNGLIRKLRKIFDVKNWGKNVYNKNKGNQTTKFTVVIIIWKAFFLKNHTQNVVEILVSDIFRKFKIKHISVSTVWNVRQFVFIICPSWWPPNYVIIIKVLIPCLNSYKAFLKI